MISMRTGSRWKLRLVLVSLAVLLLGAPLFSPQSALAHPLGNFTTNRYARIEIYRDAIHIQYVLDLAEIPTVQLTGQADTDGDGSLSAPELDAYGATLEPSVREKLQLQLGGKDIVLHALRRTVEQLPGEAGLKITRVAFLYSGAIPSGLSGSAALSFSDGNFADRTGWKEIVVRPSDGARVTVDPKLLVDSSDGLRTYPAETLKSAPNVREASLTWVIGTGESAPVEASTIAGGKARATSGFASLLNRDLSAAVFPFLLLAAFGFGMLHALGPGHGKSVVAAYLVGTKGTPRHAVALGLTVTATHTSTVYLMGFVTLSASAFFAPDTLYFYLGLAAGLSIVLMGLTLFVGRLVRLRRKQVDDGMHRHGLFGQSHSHMPPVEVPVESPTQEHQLLSDHDHDHGGDHDHDHSGAHAHPHEATPATNPRVSWRGLFALGVIGGMLPCPSAIIVMLAAIASGQVLYGMLLIVAFSAGLAGVLTAIGLVLVLGKRLGERSRLRSLLATRGAARLATALPVLSAAGITIAGLAITYQAFQQPGL